MNIGWSSIAVGFVMLIGADAFAQVRGTGVDIYPPGFLPSSPLYSAVRERGGSRREVMKRHSKARSASGLTSIRTGGRDYELGTQDYARERFPGLRPADVSTSDLPDSAPPTSLPYNELYGRFSSVYSAEGRAPRMPQASVYPFAAHKPGRDELACVREKMLYRNCMRGNVQPSLEQVCRALIARGPRC